MYRLMTMPASCSGGRRTRAVTTNATESDHRPATTAGPSDCRGTVRCRSRSRGEPMTPMPASHGTHSTTPQYSGCSMNRTSGPMNRRQAERDRDVRDHVVGRDRDDQLAAAIADRSVMFFIMNGPKVILSDEWRRRAPPRTERHRVDAERLQVRELAEQEAVEDRSGHVDQVRRGRRQREAECLAQPRAGQRRPGEPQHHDATDDGHARGWPRIIETISADAAPGPGPGRTTGRARSTTGTRPGCRRRTATAGA